MCFLKIDVTYFNRRKESKMKAIRRFLRDERGTETVEWALVLGIIVLFAIAAALYAREPLTTIYGALVTDLGKAAAGV